jgi:hypothetical protein
MESCLAGFERLVATERQTALSGVSKMRSSHVTGCLKCFEIVTGGRLMRRGRCECRDFVNRPLMRAVLRPSPAWIARQTMMSLRGIPTANVRSPWEFPIEWIQPTDPARGVSIFSVHSRRNSGSGSKAKGRPGRRQHEPEADRIENGRRLLCRSLHRPGQLHHCRHVLREFSPDLL